MREILFRGKREDNGEWVYGYYACIGKHHYILTGKLNLIGAVNFEHYLVIPETVGQYIGLTDRDGKKIFEWDIVKTEDCCYVVIWDSARATYYLSNPIAKTLTDFYHYFGEDLILIGNIHDNPELLHKGDDEQ